MYIKTIPIGKQESAGLILAFGGADSTAETVTGCIMSGASVVGYILGEGLTDAAALKNKDGDKNDDQGN